MTLISLIAAVDEQNGLGLNNELLCHLPADLLHFKNTTMNKPVLMGRNTFKSIGKPLPGRLNIVLSRTMQHVAGIEVFDSLPEVLKNIKAPELMVIGGAQVYEQLIPFAHRLYITRIHHHFSADVFFPYIDPQIWLNQNQLVRPKDEKNKYDMTFSTFERIS